ncbi:MAG: sialate O-acetylesterase [bacterium]
MRIKLLLAMSLAVAMAVGARADVKPALVFTDNAVLQQNMAVPVWGTAEPGEAVTVSFGGQNKTTKADLKGDWSVKLGKLKASADGRALTITGKNSVTLTNLVVGEVWICSGQSNMEFPLLRSRNGTNAAVASDDPLLRLFLVQKATADEPLKSVAGSWKPCDKNSAPGFSAVGYFFGRDLRAARKVPVGLIGTYWGGSPAETWTQPDVLKNNPALAGIVSNYEKRVKSWDPEKEKNSFLARQTKWSNDVVKAKAEGRPPPSAVYMARDPKADAHRPGCLYNAMIAPLAPYAIRGATWYQGESNAGRPAQYETLLPEMIGNWRRAFGVGDFPFLIVQIATYAGQPPTIREAQLHIAKKTKNTAMIVSADWGENNDIHPTHKEPVGQRLALAARNLAYDDDVAYTGPVFEKMKISGPKAVLTFDNAVGGLVAKDGELQSFTISEYGSSNFVPAKATIVGRKKIEVQAGSVKVPGAVRYGWTNYFKADLFDKSGLPASPFRTDDWPL